MADHVHKVTLRFHGSEDWSTLPGVAEIFSAHPGGRAAGLNDPTTRQAALTELVSSYLTDPDMSGVGTGRGNSFRSVVEPWYWKIDGEAVVEMSTGEKKQVDAGLLVALKQTRAQQLLVVAARAEARSSQPFQAALAAIRAAKDAAEVEAVTIDDNVEV